MKQYTANLLFRIGETNIENLSFKKLRIIFLMAIRDFKKENLTLEELLWFTSKLVQMPQDDDDKETEKLKEIIYGCSEIGFYLHRIPEVDVDGKITFSFLLETMEYYQKNKKLLE